MKKILSFIIAAALAVSLAVPMLASAADKNNFIVSKITAENGKAIVEISVENNTPFAGLDLTMYYNREAIKLTAYRKGEVINTAGALSMVNPVKTTGMVKLSAASVDGFKRAGVVLYLYFDVPESAPLYNPITLEVVTHCDIDPKPIEFSVTNGGIMRTPYVTPGEMSQPEESEVKQQADKDLEKAPKGPDGKTVELVGDTEVSEMPAQVYSPPSGSSDPNADDSDVGGEKANSEYLASVAEDESAAASIDAANSLAADTESVTQISWVTLLIAGIVLFALLAAAVLVYVFVIRKKKQENQTEQENQTNE